MKSTLLCLFLLFFSCHAFSQSYPLKGKITDAHGQSLESATVYVLQVKDSTLIDYTITDKQGNFLIQVRKFSQPVLVKASFIGFNTWQTRLEQINQSHDFGVIKLDEQAVALDEVVLKSEVPPVRVKNDTLEFDASSFQKRPDANVMALLKQLPGVEVDEEGKIRVNGREVSQILVNGKPFFGRDGTVALQNLPADIINKIQVTDLKTKSEEQTGSGAASADASINLTIDEDKNQGFMGKWTGGYGTDDRYESALMMNYFKGERKISLLASSNNINSTGFTMDEFFDSMGGGRSMTTYGDGSMSVNGINIGGGNRGITQSNLVGLNYADDFGGKEANFSYFFTDATTKNRNRTEQIVFLPEDTFTTLSTTDSRSDRFGHSFNHTFEWEKDSTWSVYFEPSINKKQQVSRNATLSRAVGQDAGLLNESSSDSYSRQTDDAFEYSLYASRNLKKKGRLISLSNYFERERVTGLNELIALNDFYENGMLTSQDNRNQQIRTEGSNQNLNFSMSYYEPIVDSLRLKVGLNFNNSKNLDDRNANDFSDISQGYTNRNEVLSFYTQLKNQNISPTVGVQINKKKLNASANLVGAFYDYNANGRYLGESYVVQKNELLPEANFYLSYRATQSKNFYTYYSLTNIFPTAEQILPIQNVANPLLITSGNENLTPARQGYGYLSFSNYNFTTKAGYNFYAGGNITQNTIVNATSFDASRRRFMTYENVGTTYYGWFGGNWNKSFKTEAHNYRITLQTNASHFLNKGLVDNVEYTANGINITPKILGQWDYGTVFTLAPSYAVTFNQTDFTNYSISSARNTLHKLNLQWTSYWPKNVILATDFGYTYNSQIADGFQKDFFLLNTSLSYQIMQKKGILKVKVYDLLNQNINNTRTITATGLRDEENVVLQRYAMFSFTYK